MHNEKLTTQATVCVHLHLHILNGLTVITPNSLSQMWKGLLTIAIHEICLSTYWNKLYRSVEKVNCTKRRKQKMKQNSVGSCPTWQMS